MKKLILLIFILGIFVTGCGQKKEEKENKKETISVSSISIEKVQKIVNHYIEYPDVDLIDVRTEEEYAEGHIEGAINIPLDHIDEINISTERELIIYCSTDACSKKAAEVLVSLGYHKVSNMGSIDAWTGDFIKN